MYASTYICIEYASTYICIEYASRYICIEYASTYICMLDVYLFSFKNAKIEYTLNLTGLKSLNVIQAINSRLKVILLYT